MIGRKGLIAIIVFSIIFGLLTYLVIDKMGWGSGYFVLAQSSKSLLYAGIGEDLIGNYGSALILYNKYLMSYPNDEVALANKAVDLYCQGNYSGALFEENKALGIYPNDEHVQKYKTLTLEMLNNHIDALALTNKVLSLQHSDRDLLYVKGLILGELGNESGALLYMKLAVKAGYQDASHLVLILSHVVSQGVK